MLPTRNKDKFIVEQFEEFGRSLGDEYLRDLTELRSGEVWSDRLFEMIRAADVFQLFWSKNAMSSAFVSQEWRYALSLGRSNFIRPVYWETPLPEDRQADLPPEELRRLHFQNLNFARTGWTASVIEAGDLEKLLLATSRELTPLPQHSAPARISLSWLGVLFLILLTAVAIITFSFLLSR